MGESDGSVYSTRVLYEDGKVRITPHPRGESEHNLWIGELEDRDDPQGGDKRDYFFIPRGVMDDIAVHGDREFAASSLDVLTQGRMNHILQDRRMSIDDVRIAFARARIKELSDALYSARAPKISSLTKDL